MRIAAVVFLFFIVAGLSKGGEDYRDTLKSVAGFERLNRIGSFVLEADHGKVPIDLFYQDSNIDPKVQGYVNDEEINGFALIAVWRDSNSNWNHRTLLGGTQIMFDKVLKESSTEIILKFKTPFFKEGKPPPRKGGTAFGVSFFEGQLQFLEHKINSDP